MNESSMKMPCSDVR